MPKKPKFQNILDFQNWLEQSCPHSGESEFDWPCKRWECVECLWELVS